MAVIFCVGIRWSCSRIEIFLLKVTDLLIKMSKFPIIFLMLKVSLLHEQVT